jgi:predicted DNA-binding protein
MHYYFMTKLNLQVRVPEDLAIQISKVSGVSGKSKSTFVREAIEEKILAETHRQLEQDWIHALKKRSEDPQEMEDWLKAESWGAK